MKKTIFLFATLTMATTQTFAQGENIELPVERIEAEMIRRARPSFGDYFEPESNETDSRKFV